MRSRVLTDLKPLASAFQRLEIIMGEEAASDNESLIIDSSSLGESDYAELDEPFPEPEPISFNGTDFDVEGLVRRVQRKDIVVPTFGHGDDTVETAGFQRDFVWRKPQMDRFIESLLLGYPVPGIFLVQQRDKRYLVLDGQQRLRTLAHFYEGTFAGHVFALRYVAKALGGLTYKALDETQRRTLDNSFIQAIVVRTDGTTQSLESVYQIFERLNSGGTQLTGHEIRVALYAGPLIDFVAGLNADSGWRALYGPPSPRLRDQELILRILALFVSPGTYRRPLKRFLNEFAGSNRDCSNLDTTALKLSFSRACQCFLAAPGPSAFRHAGRQVNVAMTEAIMVGMMRRLEAGGRPSTEGVKAALERLSGDPEFVHAITRATADEENVKARTARASQALASA
jgi:hypothetical protein